MISATEPTPALGTPVGRVLRGAGELAEDDARGAAAQLYARLRTALGVPFVPTVFRLLARHERYLAAAVDALGGLVSGPAGQRAAHDMRLAAAQVATAEPPARLPAGAALPAVTALIERYNQANPRGLLFIRALARGLGAPDPEAPTTAVMQTPLPPATGDLLGDIRRAHGGVTVPGLWRELSAGWPALAAAGWTEVRCVAGTGAFHATRERLVAIADGVVAGAAVTPAQQLTADAEATRDVERIVRAFEALIPTMVVEIECLRAALVPGTPG